MGEKSQSGSQSPHFSAVVGSVTVLFYWHLNQEFQIPLLKFYVFYLFLLGYLGGQDQKQDQSLNSLSPRPATMQTTHCKCYWILTPATCYGNPLHKFWAKARAGSQECYPAMSHPPSNLLHRYRMLSRGFFGLVWFWYFFFFFAKDWILLETQAQ